MPSFLLGYKHIAIKTAVVSLSMLGIVQGGALMLEAFALMLRDSELEWPLMIGTPLFFSSATFLIMSIETRDRDIEPVGKSSYQAVSHV